jgi:hypothetical protein
MRACIISKASRKGPFFLLHRGGVSLLSKCNQQRTQHAYYQYNICYNATAKQMQSTCNESTAWSFLLHNAEVISALQRNQLRAQPFQLRKAISYEQPRYYISSETAKSKIGK